MFYCVLHYWYSTVRPCPACQKEFIVTTSDSTPHSNQSIKEEQGGLDLEGVFNDFINKKYQEVVAPTSKENQDKSNQAIEERLRWSDRKKTVEEQNDIKEWVDFLEKHPSPAKNGNEWRIVRWKTKDGGYYTDWMSAHGVKNLTIESVKRLSDGQIFSVGDMISTYFKGGDGFSDKIHHFTFTSGVDIIDVYFEKFNKALNISDWLKNAQKILSKPQPTKEKTEVTFLSEFAGESFHYVFATKKIPKDKYELVKQAIELALNGVSAEELTALGNFYKS